MVYLFDKVLMNFCLIIRWPGERESLNFDVFFEAHKKILSYKTLVKYQFWYIYKDYKYSILSVCICSESFGNILSCLPFFFISDENHEIMRHQNLIKLKKKKGVESTVKNISSL